MTLRTTGLRPAPSRSKNAPRAHAPPGARSRSRSPRPARRRPVSPLASHRDERAVMAGGTTARAAPPSGPPQAERPATSACPRPHARAAAVLEPGLGGRQRVLAHCGHDSPGDRHPGCAPVLKSWFPVYAAVSARRPDATRCSLRDAISGPHGRFTRRALAACGSRRRRAPWCRQFARVRAAGWQRAGWQISEPGPFKIILGFAAARGGREAGRFPAGLLRWRVQLMRCDSQLSSCGSHAGASLGGGGGAAPGRAAEAARQRSRA